MPNLGTSFRGSLFGSATTTPAKGASLHSVDADDPPSTPGVGDVTGDAGSGSIDDEGVVLADGAAGASSTRPYVLRRLELTTALYRIPSFRCASHCATIFFAQKNDANK
jgi:hypothetical protein